MRKIKFVYIVWLLALLLILVASSCTNAEERKEYGHGETNDYLILEIKGHTYIIFKGYNAIHDEACENHKK